MEDSNMRKKRFTKYVGILVGNETFDQLVEETDKEEITISKFIRQLIEERLKTEGREKTNE
jgi:hypothetical protein